MGFFCFQLDWNWFSTSIGFLREIEGLLVTLLEIHHEAELALTAAHYLLHLSKEEYVQDMHPSKVCREENSLSRICLCISSSRVLK